MALFKLNKKPKGWEDTPYNQIKKYRLQMLVHSYLYYELDENIITDRQWTERAVKLAKLQNDYPDIAKEVKYADMFKDWDGSTGFNLTYDNETISKAMYLLGK